MPGDRAPDYPCKLLVATSEVFAYRLPIGDVPIAQLHPKITTRQRKGIETALLTDGDYAKPVDLPSAPVGQKAWIGYEFAKPVTIQSVVIVLADPSLPATVSNHHGDCEIFLEASDDE